jgi:hypothetical protein
MDKTPYEKELKFTKKYGLRRCSMNRCCNAVLVNKAIKVAELYASMNLKEYPDLGDAARRFLKEVKNER